MPDTKPQAANPPKVAIPPIGASTAPNVTTDKAARVAELVKKRNAGTATPKEMEEFAALMKAGLEADTRKMQTQGIMAAEDPAKLAERSRKADEEIASKMLNFDAMKAAANQFASMQDPGLGMIRPSGPAPVGKTWIQADNGSWFLVDTITAKREDLQINPEVQAIFDAGKAKAEAVPAAPVAPPEEPVAPAEPRLADVIAAQEAQPKESAVAKMLAGMKAELGTDKGPSFWDVLQAAAAGWNFQTPAYLEKKKTKEAQKAEIEKLEKTAALETALGEEEATRKQSENIQLAELQHAMDLERLREEARLKGLGGVGSVAGLTKGQQLAAGLVGGK